MTARSSNNSAGAGLLAQYYILLSIATGLVSLRCYGRLRLQNGLGWDDYSSVAALVSPLAVSSSIILSQSRSS